MKNFHSDNGNKPKRDLDSNKSFVTLSKNEITKMIIHHLGLSDELFNIEWYFYFEEIKITLTKKVN